MNKPQHSKRGANLWDWISKLVEEVEGEAKSEGFREGLNEQPKDVWLEPY